MFAFVEQRYPSLWPYIQLMRLDRPIGTLLLLWPTLWAVWIAGNGTPSLKTVVIFILGVIIMRAAGCVINDFADRDFDGDVERTKGRPLATGAISAKKALALFCGLGLLAFVLVLFLNELTFWLSFGGLGLAVLYPFTKRFSFMPQLFLGAAFSWAIPMAFAAETGAVPEIAWLLYVANLVWTVAYDTEYAMVDRDDDLKIGIKSTAVLFGRWDTRIIALLQLATLGLLAWAGSLLALGGFYWLGWLAMGATFVHQQRLIKSRDRDRCFQAFLNNHWSGLLLFAGLGLSLYPSLG